jgi:diguanylate cyclase (GGDEF)-like protein
MERRAESALASRGEGEGRHLKDTTRRRLLIASAALSSTAVIEYLALQPSTSSVLRPEALQAQAWIALRYAMQALPALLLLGMLLCRVLARGKKETRLRALFAQGGVARPILLLGWIIAVCLADELLAASSRILAIGLTAAALYSWRRPRLLIAAAIVGAASVGIADTLLRGSVDAERLLIVAVSAVLCVMAGAVVRSAFLHSADRLSSLETENKKLWELSFRDGLTGLFNRRYSQEVGSMLFSRAKRYNEHLHVLMLDIDHFKAVNDKLGHPVGDEVLKIIAGIFMGQVRASDVVIRYGGEEFLIFLIQTEPEVVQFIANRIRDGVAVHVFPNVPWQLSISIGVAGIKADDTLFELVDRADKYLYASKRAGRNRVTGF